RRAAARRNEHGNDQEDEQGDEFCFHFFISFGLMFRVYGLTSISTSAECLEPPQSKDRLFSGLGYGI
ncbi:MAG: hypothetical protein L6Q49_20955, partial [Anaerolineales bacterium]|nr:hypothetical protein [Anaerolineales bacterium]